MSGGPRPSCRLITESRRLREELEQANRQLGTAYEELQSTNEELETTNEELQSTVEELETTLVRVTASPLHGADGSSGSGTVLAMEQEGSSEADGAGSRSTTPPARPPSPEADAGDTGTTR